MYWQEIRHNVMRKNAEARGRLPAARLTRTREARSFKDAPAPMVRPDFNQRHRAGPAVRWIAWLGKKNVPYRPNTENGSKQSEPSRTFTPNPAPHDQTPCNKNVCGYKCENDFEWRLAARIRPHLARSDGTAERHDAIRRSDGATKHHRPSPCC
jgi:hypothetical protein